MTEKRFKLRIHPKDNGVKIFDEQADDGYRRLFDVSYVDYESAKQLRARLEPVVNLLNELSDENEQLKQYKQAVSDVLLSYSQKNLSAKQLGLLTAIMHELGVDFE